MAVDKLVDSAQLDADLASVANAIRTKGGTSASLAFPADFVSAIAAIPSGGGGSGTFKSGTITLASDVTIGATATAFPGLELGFFPEFFLIYMDKTSFNDFYDGKTTAQNGRFYVIYALKYNSEIIPLRISGSVEADSVSISTNGYYLFAMTSATAFSTPPGGFGISFPSTPINLDSYPGWDFDSDGKLYLRRLAAGNQGILAGTYRYIAGKGA